MNAAHRKRIPLWIFGLLIVPIHAVAAPPDFELEVAPILINHCLKCHHQGKSSGGLNLAVIEEAQRGGESGPAISTEPKEKSLLFARIEAGEMPPPNQHDRPLTKAEIKTIGDWIASGANWPKAVNWVCMSSQSASTKHATSGHFNQSNGLPFHKLRVQIRRRTRLMHSSIRSDRSTTSTWDKKRLPGNCSGVLRSI